MHSHLGVLGVTGFLMKNLSANPLDYVEGGAFNSRRAELSAILDGTNPDLSAFQKRGGKMIVTIGTNDTLASPGAQLDYYQSVLDRMGRADRRSLRTLFRDAADRPWTDRHQLQCGRRRTDYSCVADSEPLRSAWSVVRLGREGAGARDVRDRDRRRPEPSAVFLSVVSTVPDG